MSGKRKGYGSTVLLGLLLLAAAAGLVLRGRQASQAAVEGLGLCCRVIVPSLFPFFVLSSMAVELGLAGYMGRGLEKLMRPLFGVSGAGASALVMGLIGGYPVGAATAAGLYEKGLCGREETERLLTFCSNCGPAFIFGAVGSGIFGDSRMGLLLWLAHVAGAVLVGVIFRLLRRGRITENNRGRSPIAARSFSAAFTLSVKSALSSILNVCAYVVFFAVVIRMLKELGVFRALLPGWAWGEGLLTGVVELSSGVCALEGEGDLTARIILASFMLGWGGVSVHCQTLSFLSGSGLSAKGYLAGKAVHGVLSALLAALLLRVFPLDVQTAAGGTAAGLFSLKFFWPPIACAVGLGLIWTILFSLARRLVRKRSGKGKKSVV